MHLVKFLVVPVAGLLLVFGGTVALTHVGEASPASGHEQPESLHWDLRAGHTTAQVAWPDALLVHEYSDGVDVRLDLPGGKGGTVVEEHVDRVELYRHGNEIYRIDLLYPDTTLERAYQRAKRLGEQWGLPSGELDQWYKRQVAARVGGSWDRLQAHKGGVMRGKAWAKGAPMPAVYVFDTFDAEKPSYVCFRLTWD